MSDREPVGQPEWSSSPEKTPAELLVDLLVNLPVEILAEVLEEIPSAFDNGRRRFSTELRSARFAGELAVRLSQAKVRGLREELLGKPKGPEGGVSDPR
jgi:hypothetical protein